MAARLRKSPQTTTNSFLEPSVPFAPPESHECNQRILRRQQSKSNPLIAVPFIYYRSTTKGGPSTGVTVDPLAMTMFGGERLTAGASETAGEAARVRCRSAK
jgi:hypothetical protein